MQQKSVSTKKGMNKTAALMFLITASIIILVSLDVFAFFMMKFL